MKAAVWRGRQDVRIENVPDPALVNPHDAIVRVALTAICGSDLHLYNGFVPGMRSGDVLGHELMGEVISVGRACERVKVGDRVVVMCGISCGRCWFCKKELYSSCDNTNPAGSQIALELAYGHAGAALFGYSHLYGGYAGGQAEYIRVPFADVGCLKVPAELSDDQVLFLGDIFPSGFMAAENCNIEPGDTIAVFGCGPVGQFAIRSAQLLGAERVIAIDSIPERLAMAADAGAIVLDENHGDLMRRLDDLTGGRGPDACIDAVGLEAHGTGIFGAYDKIKQALRLETDRPMALRHAIMACRKGGTVSIPGVYGGFIDKFPIGAAFSKGLTFKMGQTQFHKYAPRLLERITAREIDPAFVITHRVSLDELPSAYKMFNGKLDGCVKVVAQPG
ncbi:MAG: theronine dehydrogenase-like Zn-dependent dehydrogenase [Myxococcales bacterium]|nr:theronine dehydrogenase-like Zn-dependent dehydrogenase [Myxococcales bacterium]